LAALSARAQPAAQQNAPVLLVKASLSTAGPYGEGWYLTLTPDGDVALQVFYSTNPSGSLMARFTVAEERIDDLRRTIDAERFFDLPTEVSPKTRAFHRPDFRLDVTVSGRQHKVSLYDPGELTKDDAARRFLVVWGRLFEGLPLKPSWK
jgi:hypothetical protein